MVVNYSVEEIKKAIGSELFGTHPSPIHYIQIDTRKIRNPKNTLFWTLKGIVTDGHQFVEEAYKKGVRIFVVGSDFDHTSFPNACFLKVQDRLKALQSLAQYHRSKWKNTQVVGITGSNGKTIIKEWAYQMLFDLKYSAKSPKSYNSQIGVPLSIFHIREEHELALLEAGISTKGEMETLSEIIQPSIGIFTNIGRAHDEGFTNKEEKIKEKALLFKHSKTIICHSIYPEIIEILKEMYPDKRIFTWGESSTDSLHVESEISESKRFITININDKSVRFDIDQIDSASFENLMFVISLGIVLGIPTSELIRRKHRMKDVSMRLEMTKGIANTMIINDAYSADLDSLKVALDFMAIQGDQREKCVILSSLDQSGMRIEDSTKALTNMCQESGISNIIYICDSNIKANSFDPIQVYKSTNAFLSSISLSDFTDKLILVKGARRFKMEKVSKFFSLKSHSAELKINLAAIQNNLRVYQSLLDSKTGIIAVIKASAYGSGGDEIAKLLENNSIDYFAVAFADEGVKLRQSGIKTPILVLNPDFNSVYDLLNFNLEPEVYTLHQLKLLSSSIDDHQIIKVHIKLDSGMHRLGFQMQDIQGLHLELQSKKNIKVESVFTHLASSEDAADDNYTNEQLTKFDFMYESISEKLGYTPKKHALNSSGISRFPNHQYDMVRLGIGLYGLDSNPKIKNKLQKAHRLEASIIQIKQLKNGDSIGYNRKTILEKDTQIGVLNIGYADGLNRLLSNRNYSVYINGGFAEILGNVCMDLTIVDLTNVKNPIVGDKAIIFDQDHPIESLAQKCQTIPYEILSRISERVKRVYLSE